MLSGTILILLLDGAGLPSLEFSCGGCRGGCALQAGKAQPWAWHWDDQGGKWMEPGGFSGLSWPCLVSLFLVTFPSCQFLGPSISVLLMALRFWQVPRWQSPECVCSCFQRSWFQALPPAAHGAGRLSRMANRHRDSDSI